MSHTIHPPILEAGLCDACPDCVRKTIDPLSSLDDANLSALWERMLAVEFDYAPQSPDVRYRSEAEAAVCSQMLTWARFLERIGVDPRGVTIPLRAF